MKQHRFTDKPKLQQKMFMGRILPACQAFVAESPRLPREDEFESVDSGVVTNRRYSPSIHSSSCINPGQSIALLPLDYGSVRPYSAMMWLFFVLSQILAAYANLESIKCHFMPRDTVPLTFAERRIRERVSWQKTNM
jgi:hypothetical protein